MAKPSGGLSLHLNSITVSMNNSICPNKEERVTHSVVVEQTSNQSESVTATKQISSDNSTPQP